MAKESVYTEKVLADLKALEPLNWEKATEYAEKNGFKPMGIVNSAKRNGIDYEKKVRATKTGAKIESKSDLVARYAASRNRPVEDFDGLEKATKTALENLF